MEVAPFGEGGAEVEEETGVAVLEEDLVATYLADAAENRLAVPAWSG